MALDLALLASALRTAWYTDVRQCTAMYAAVKPVHAAYGGAFCTHARGSTTMYVSVGPRAAMYGRRKSPYVDAGRCRC